MIEKSEAEFASIERAEPAIIFADLRTLRSAIIRAWEERGVMMTRDEQKALREEIMRTCELLIDLTASD